MRAYPNISFYLHPKNSLRTKVEEVTETKSSNITKNKPIDSSNTIYRTYIDK